MHKHFFGTDGIRAKAGTSPLTKDELPKLGYAIAQWAIAKCDILPHFFIGYDTRESSSWITQSLITGMQLHPIVLHDIGIVPTPLLFHLIKEQSIPTYGIMISASHNPYYDNGIKIVTPEGEKLSLEDETAIEILYSNQNSLPTKMQGSIVHFDSAIEQYMHKIQQYILPNCLAGKTIVLDTAHGATSTIAPIIFSALGGNIITINNNPNGTNINDNCGALHLEQLQKAVISYKADIGFAFDDDGDRVIAVDSNGQIKDGDDLLVILSTHPEFEQFTTIVGTIMSNQGCEQYLKQKNKIFIRTPVGDKYVAQALIETGAGLGGEQSGHIIIKEFANTGDGIAVALKVLETLYITNNWGLNTFTKYPQILVNLPVTHKKDLNQDPIAELVKDQEAILKTGRILLRYSGTESLLRIMVEGPDKELTSSVSTTLLESLRQQLL